MKIHRIRRKAQPNLKLVRVIFLLYGILFVNMEALAHAQDSSKFNVTGEISSRRYDQSQKFSGKVFRKDNNIWTYTREFAELFGMPMQHVSNVQGVAAAAFRVENTSFQECGFYGKEELCRQVDVCLLDLYFDETKHPLPWATHIKSQWRPSYSSMIWLQSSSRSERPNGMLNIEPSSDVIRNPAISSTFIPFADPSSKTEAIFTTNAQTDRGDSDAVSGALAIRGYTRDFYRNLSVVNLQFGCSPTNREKVDIRLNAIKINVFEVPVARFNRIVLPPVFINKINDRIRIQNEGNPIPNQPRSLLGK